VVLVEFALVSIVFFAMIIGGLFVFLDVLAKTQATGATPAAANFLAAGGCQTSTGDCADGASPDPTCANPANHQNLPPEYNGPTQHLHPSPTLATICEIKQIIGNSLIDTPPNSLQVDIYCTPNAYPSSAERSGQSCANATAVWVCARGWNSNVYFGVNIRIIGPSWISSESEQMVMPLPPTTGVPTSTYIPKYPTLDFDTFYWANTGSAQYGTGNMACGPPT